MPLGGQHGKFGQRLRRRGGHDGMQHVVDGRGRRGGGQVAGQCLLE